MTTTTAMPRLLTIEEWERAAAGHEGREELVGGIPIMSPTEAARNSRAARRLAHLLEEAFAPEWAVFGALDIQLSELTGPGTVREPDVVLLRGDIDDTRHRFHPQEVGLVAEIVSPGSVETDWITKRDEYARAGIPRYLVVDLRDETPRMALFEDPHDGVYRSPTGRGDRTRIEIGADVAEFALDDLAR